MCHPSGMTTKKPPKGPAMLAKAAKEAGSQRALAKQLGLCRESIAQWLQGLSRPSANARLVLLDRLGIPFDSWGSR